MLVQKNQNYIWFYIVNGNYCLNFDILKYPGFSLNIPISLINLYGIIKLNNAVSETDFWKGLLSPVPLEAFKCNSIKKYGNIQTGTIELKLRTPKIPNHISLFKVTFEVKPSIRSSVQCNHCLYFGHTQKYCYNDQKSSHFFFRYLSDSKCFLTSSNAISIDCDAKQFWLAISKLLDSKAMIFFFCHVHFFQIFFLA